MPDQAATLRGARDASGQMEGIRPPLPSRRVMGIVSGKGGVGKSAIAVNLAVASAACGANVLLIDGDVGIANADLLLGLIPPFTLDHWIGNECNLDDLLCQGPNGLSLLVAGESPIAVRRLGAALNRESACGLDALLDRFDLIFVDLGAGVEDRVLSFAEACASILLVATPEPTSLADAYSILKRLDERSPASEIELIVNRARNTAEGQRTHRSLDRLALRFLTREIPLRAILPEDVALGRSVFAQSPLVLENPGSSAARRLDLIAQSLVEEASGDRNSAWPGEDGQRIGSEGR